MKEKDKNNWQSSTWQAQRSDSSQAEARSDSCSHSSLSPLCQGYMTVWRTTRRCNQTSRWARGCMSEPASVRRCRWRHRAADRGWSWCGPWRNWSEKKTRNKFVPYGKNLYGKWKVTSEPGEVLTVVWQMARYSQKKLLQYF